MTFEGYKNYLPTCRAGPDQDHHRPGCFDLHPQRRLRPEERGGDPGDYPRSDPFLLDYGGIRAVAYAWYVGAAGSEKLELVTTINSATFSAPLVGGTNQAASALTSTDNSANSAVAYDGFISTAVAGGSGAYVKTLATGTPGTGTVLTASNRGSINEIDAMFQSMWNNNQVSPTVLFVNAQELQNITNKVLQGASGGAVWPASIWTR
jgi:hypothetical protein